VVTDWLLVSTGLSFHNCTTKQHHVSIFGIFSLFRLVATCAEQAEYDGIEANGVV
jgi:hypothetical protein